MAIRVRHDLLDADGFQLATLDGTRGTVDEVWLGEDGEPSALIVRGDDGHRALIEARDVIGVDLDTQEVYLANGAQLLDLEARTAPKTGHVADEPTPLRRMSIVRGIAFMFGTIAFIVCTLIGLDFLFAYLVGGGPPY